MDYKAYYDKYALDYYSARQGGLIFNEGIEIPVVLDLLTHENLDERCTALDIGCGFGFYTKHLAQLGCEVTAVELSESMVRVAKDYCGEYEKNITFINNNFLSAKLPSKYYKLIIGSFMLSYFSNLDVLFRKVSELVKHDATVIFSMLHPIVQSKIKKSENGYYITDYFSNQSFESDFLNKENPIQLIKWGFNDVFLACKKANLFVDQLIEPRLETSADASAFYNKCPSVAIFIIKVRPDLQ